MAHQGEEARLGRIGLFRALPCREGRGGSRPQTRDQLSALAHQGADGQGGDDKNEKEDIIGAHLPHPQRHRRQFGDVRDGSQHHRPVALQGEQPADRRRQNQGDRRPGRGQAKGHQQHGRQDQIGHCGGLGENPGRGQGQQQQKSDRLHRARGAFPVETMSPRQQQQGGRDDQQPQQFHAEHVPPDERPIDIRIVAQPGAGRHGQGRAERHRRRGSQQGEGDQATRPPHIQGRAADTTRQDRCDQHLGQVQDRIDEQQRHRVAAQGVAGEIQDETGDQNGHGLAAMKLKQGGQHDAVGRPDDNGLKGRCAPLANQKTDGEQSHIG